MPAMRLASPRHPSGGVLALVAVLLVAMVQGAFELATHGARDLEAARWLRFGTNAASVVLFTVLPTLAPRLARTRWAWRTAAIAPMLWFPALHHGWTWAFGSSFVGALSVLLALLTCRFVNGPRITTGRAHERAAVAPAGATMPSLSRSAQLTAADHLGWALEAAALLALYQRLGHRASRGRRGPLPRGAAAFCSTCTCSLI
jgi:hypothetical protein